MDLLRQLKENYRYSDFYMPDERYEQYLRQLRTVPLTQELVDYLCTQIDNPKSKRSCELRFIHLQPLFLNPTAAYFDLKDFLYDHLKRCRRPWLRMFYLRAYAQYATEQELEPQLAKFEDMLRKYHDYQDFAQILSPAGLPFLVRQYGYPRLKQTLAVAIIEYTHINPKLRGFFTLTESGDPTSLLPPEEIHRRFQEYLREKEETIRGLQRTDQEF